jgi:hypothetical protein
VQPNSCILGNTYYFFSNGQVLTAATGAAAPATPGGATLIASREVTASNFRAACTSASPTSPLFPESRGWQVTSRDRGNVLGGGAKYDFGRARLDMSFTRSLQRSRIGYSYNPAALGMTPLQVALAGNGLSDITFAQNTLSASLVVPLRRDLALNLIGRYESGKYRDWHYDAVNVNPMPVNNAVYLDAGAQDYRAYVFGILLRFTM